MKNRILLLISCIALLGCLPTATSAHIIPVLVTDSIFSPDTLPTVSIGDTIRWKWRSGNQTTTSTSLPDSAIGWNAPINSHDTVFDYIVLVAGTYRFRSDSDTTMRGIFEATSFTGIRSIVKQEATLNIYPNPTTSMANILWLSTVAGPTVVRIYDVTGKEVYNQQNYIAVGQNTLSLPLSQLQQGVYIAQLWMDDKQIGLQRIIKQ